MMISHDENSHSPRQNSSESSACEDPSSTTSNIEIDIESIDEQDNNASQKVQTTIRNDPQEEGKSGIIGATFNFVNSIVGAGIIGIPFAIQRSGLYTGILLVFLVAFLVNFGVRLLVKSGKETRTHTYEDLCHHLFGPRGYYLTLFSMFIFAYGGMVAYIIIIGDTVSTLTLEYESATSFFAHRSVAIISFSTTFILPLCLLKDMSSLAMTSSVSVLAVIVLVAIVSHSAGEEASRLKISAETEPSPFSLIRPSFFAGIGSISFAYTCHHSSFFVANSMARPSQKRWDIVTDLSIGISLVLSLILGLSGYLAFFSAVQSDILNNFDAANTAINVARGLLASTMVFTFPMEQFVARHCLQSLFNTPSPSQRVHVGLTIVLWGSSVGIALVLKDVGFVLELTGALAASMLGFILPGLIYFKLHPFPRNPREFKKLSNLSISPKSCEDSSSIVAEVQTKRQRDFIVPAFMIVLGMFLLFFGTISAFYD